MDWNCLFSKVLRSTTNRKNIRLICVINGEKQKADSLWDEIDKLETLRDRLRLIVVGKQEALRKDMAEYGYTYEQLAREAELVKE